MYKKLILSSFICVSLLVSNVGCAKKSHKSDDDPSRATASNGESTLSASANVAISSNLNKETVNALLAKFKENFPQLQISKVDSAPIHNFYQLVANGNIIYVSHDGHHMLVGDLINLANKVNLTEEVRKNARIDLLKSVSESDMVVFTPKGKVEHTVTVFTDVDCGYCRKFHQEIQSYLDQGIKVRYMSFPRAGRGSDSYNKAVTVWCAKDRNQAMNQAKLTESFKPDATLCDNKKIIDHSMELVQSLGLNGTPALILEDGTLLPGYVPADRLKTALDANVKKNNEVLTSEEHPAAG